MSAIERIRDALTMDKGTFVERTHTDGMAALEELVGQVEACDAVHRRDLNRISELEADPPSSYGLVRIRELEASLAQLTDDVRLWKDAEAMRTKERNKAEAERDRAITALDLVDLPYPIEVFPERPDERRDAIFAAMRAVNKYATEWFYAHVARERGRVAREAIQAAEREAAE